MDDIEQFVASQRSENTKRAYRQDLAAWVEWLDGRNATVSTVTEYRDYLEANLSNATALRRFTTVRMYFKWVGVLDSPFERVKAPRRVSDWSPIIPDEAKINRLLEVCNNPKHRAIISLLNNGLRAQEVCDLRAADFYFEPV